MAGHMPWAGPGGCGQVASLPHWLLHLRHTSVGESYVPFSCYAPALGHCLAPPLGIERCLLQLLSNGRYQSDRHLLLG
jgi:hypothetical protein